MDRREMLLTLGGVAGARAIAVGTVLPNGALQLDPGAVELNVTVDQGYAKTFRLSLIRKPWPTMGQEIQLRHEGLVLRGTVTALQWETLGYPKPVFRCRVQGTVHEFDGRAVLGEG